MTNKDYHLIDNQAVEIEGKRHNLKKKLEQITMASTSNQRAVASDFRVDSMKGPKISHQVLLNKE